MNDKDKDKTQLIKEMIELRQRIAELEKAEEILERINHRNELILNHASEGILGLNSQGMHTFVNPSAARMLGYSVDELLQRRSHPIWHHTKTDGSPYPEEESPIYASYTKGAVQDGVRDEVFWRKDGTSFPVAYTSTPIIENNEVAGAVVSFVDITERKKADDALKISEENLRRLMDRNPVAMAVADKSGKFIYFNSRFIETFGYTLEDIPTVDHWWPLAYPDKEYRENIIGIWRAAVKQAIKNKDQTESKEARVTCKDGSSRDIEFRMAPLQDVNIVIFNDITEVKKTEELLRRLSTTDELTGLANRRAFDLFLSDEWRRALRDRRQISLMMIDVDFFKQYNDTYGHLKGDACLRSVAEVLEAVARRPGDKVARFGGEEFVVMLSSVDSLHAVAIAERIRMNVEALRIPHEKSGINEYVTLSIGVVSIIPQQNLSPINLIESADEALYKAKEEGRNRVVISIYSSSQITN